MRNTKRALVALFLICFFLPLPTYAAPSLEGGLQTDYMGIAAFLGENEDLVRTKIAYEGPPGATIEDAVTIMNLADIPISVLMDSVDNVPAATTFTLKNSADPKEFIGKWITFKDSTNPTLRPQEIRTIPFTIKIPEESTSGDFIGAVTMEETDASATIRTPPKSSESHMLVKTRLGMRISVKVNPALQAPQRLLIGTVFRSSKDSLQKRFGTLSIWKKIIFNLSASYLLGFLLWEGFEFIKRHKKIHPKFHRIIIPARWLSLAALIISFSFWFFANASAEAFSIAAANGDGRLSFKVNPGDTVKGEVQITNSGRKSAFAEVSPVDGTVSAQGYLALAQGGQGNVTVAISEWAKIVGESKFFLKVGEARKVPFIIQVPENITPGDYVGGIVVQEAPNPKDFDKGGFVIQNRAGMFIHLSVLGEKITAFEASDLKLSIQSSGSIQGSLHIKNTGNVIVKPTVMFYLVNSEGETIGEFRKDIGELLPKGELNLAVDLPWNKADLKFGTYKILAKVSDGGEGRIESVSSTVKVPLPLVYKASIGGAVAFVFAIILLSLFFWKRKHRVISSQPEPPLQTPVP